ncbi:MAG: sulfatase-like hydrolase/transferase [Weeksellaceae bacterium]|nr:sulfatase-like hydrolase/transferase [Weeksellaceae bacterium]
MNFLLKGSRIYIFIILFSMLDVFINEAEYIFEEINFWYRILLTIGLFFSAVFFSKYWVGKIISILLFLLLTVNFSASFIARSIYKTKFDQTQAANILLTNSNEASGMLSGYVFQLIMSALYFFIAVFLLYALLIKSKEKKHKRIAIIISGITVLLAIALSFDYMSKQGKFMRKWNSNFSRILNKTPYFNFAMLNETRYFLKETEQIKAIKVEYPYLCTNDNTIENLIIVIGESARRDALSLYGNPIPTTPNADKRKNQMLIYENAIAPSAYTILCVPYMLSRALPEEKVNASLYADNLIHLANEGNWSTYWFSSQEQNGYYANAITAIASMADEQKWHNKIYDEYLIPLLEESLKDTNKKRLIFLHLSGSHGPAARNFPRDFKKVTSGEGKVIDDYYNSIAYTDYVLEEVVKLMEDQPSIMIYLSDHGQSRSNHDFHHSFTQKGLQVPFYIWHSDKVSEKFKQNGTISEMVSTSDFYEIVKFYLGIETRSSKALNSDFKVLSGERKVLNYNEIEKGR